MGVRFILGTLPVISAEVLLGLRAPDGSRPCSGGLRKALQWIDDREIPIDQALEEAKGVLSPSDLEWGLKALGLRGYGYGYGYGDSSSSGHGYGYGSSYGYAYDDGSGDGYGARDGYGYSYNTGGGYSFGDGYCDGSGFGEEQS